MFLLRDLRTAKGMSMKELGNIFGLAESTISLYETEKRQPDFSTLIKFAEYFDVSVDYLLGRNSNVERIFSMDTRISKLLKLYPNTSEDFWMDIVSRYDSQKLSHSDLLDLLKHNGFSDIDIKTVLNLFSPANDLYPNLSEDERTIVEMLRKVDPAHRNLAFTTISAFLSSLASSSDADAKSNVSENPGA